MLLAAYNVVSKCWITFTDLLPHVRNFAKFALCEVDIPILKLGNEAWLVSNYLDAVLVLLGVRVKVHPTFSPNEKEGTSQM